MHMDFLQRKLMDGSEMCNWRLFAGSDHLQQYAMDAIAAAWSAPGRPTIRHQPLVGATTEVMFRHFIAWAASTRLIPEVRLRVILTHDGILASSREVAAGREQFAAAVLSAKVLISAWISFNVNEHSPAGSAEDLRAVEEIYFAVMRQGAAAKHLHSMVAARQQRAIRRMRRGGFSLVHSQPITEVVTINEQSCC